MDHIMSYEEYLRDVKKGIVTDLGNCPVTPLLVMLQGKWKTQILYELCIHDTVRFGTLKKELPGITNTMLTSFLRELEWDGPSTGYSTTRSRPAWNIPSPSAAGI